MSEAQKPLLDILNSRENGVIDSDEELEEEIIKLLNNPIVKAALFKGDDPKSWYKPLSAWKKMKFDHAYTKWKLKSR